MPPGKEPGEVPEKFENTGHGLFWGGGGVGNKEIWPRETCYKKLGGQVERDSIALIAYTATNRLSYNDEGSVPNCSPSARVDYTSIKSNTWGVTPQGGRPPFRR